MNLKIKITLETKRLLMLRGGIRTNLWCAECGMETDFVAEKEIADILLKLKTDEHLHKISATDGTRLVCLDSLSKNQN